MENAFLRAAVRAKAVGLALAKGAAVAVPTGLVCGVVGTAFHLAVELAGELRGAHGWLLWLLPVAGLGITALYKALRCEGVGTNQILHAVQSGEPLSLRLVPAIFLGTVLTHLCGGSAGREGAALQMGGSIGWQMGRLLRLRDHERRAAVVCGMAAFFSALFGTPLAAALFALMVPEVGTAFYAVLLPALCGALIAYGVSVGLGVAPTRFAVEVPAFSAGLALRAAVLAAVCAAAAWAFCRLLHAAEHEMARRLPNPWVRTVCGGLAVAALSCVLGAGRYNGAGMAVISAAVEQGRALPWDFACKMVLTALTLAAGYKGGEVVPCFYIGATLGCVLGPLLGLPAGFAAALGLVAVFCGATNTPVPSLALALELFGGQGLWFFALVCAVSYTLSGDRGLYASQRLLTEKLAPERRPR